MSLPSWGRGLKWVVVDRELNGNMSLPSWGRGLKFDRVINYKQISARRSLRGGVD